MEHPFDGRLAQRAQHEGRNRNSKLAGGQVVIQLMGYLSGRNRPFIPFCDQLIDPGQPHLQDGEFGANENAVSPMNTATKNKFNAIIPSNNFPLARDSPQKVMV